MKLEEALKIIACKHASSSSATQQSADIGRQFCIVKYTSKTTTAVNLPNGFGLKDFISDIFDEYKSKGILHFKLPARKAILDHIVSCSEIFGKAMSPKTTRKGFIENGMIDEYTETYPDIVRMLQTCKGEVSQVVEDIIFNNFSELYRMMKKEGHIKEEMYNRLGLPKDTNYDKEIIEKPDQIRQEMRHRAKILR